MDKWECSRKQGHMNTTETYQLYMVSRPVANPDGTRLLVPLEMGELDFWNVFLA